MSGYIGTQPVPQATQTRDAFTATAGQTSFATSGYTPSFLDVYLNGIKLAAADYTASNGSDVVLSTGAALGDILEVVAYTAFESANHYTKAESVAKAGDTMTGDLAFGDNVKASFGAGSDLQIYHDGSNSFIDEVGAGNLVLKAGSATYLQNASGVTMGVFGVGNAATLYNSGAAKLATTSTGVDVTGTITSNGLVSSGVSGTTLIQAVGGDSNGFADVEIKSTGTSGASRLYFSDTAGQLGSIRYSHSTDAMLFSTNGASRINIANNGDISFYEDTGTTAKFFWDASAESLGIGKTNPATTLDVSGTVTATSYAGDGSSLTGIAAGAGGGGNDEIFWENGQTVTTNYTITNGKNAMSAGPITINSGVTVTVGAGETWTVV